MVYTETGGILSEPKKQPFGFIPVLMTFFPFLYIGATIGKEFAAWMEENEIFVPDDDDDD